MSKLLAPSSAGISRVNFVYFMGGVLRGVWGLLVAVYEAAVE